MSRRRGTQHRRTRRAVALLPTPTAAASAKVQLALRLRNEANLTGRCPCGARGRLVEILENGTLRPAGLVEPGRLYRIEFAHENDCPAISPEIERALARGEIDDPAGDLLAALLQRGRAA
jgi:hypothetical protein